MFDVIPDLIDRTGIHAVGRFPRHAVFPHGPPPGTVIPEPATGGLLAIGLAALAMRRKRA